MDQYLIKGGTILTFDPAQPVLENQSLLIDDGRVISIAPEAEFSLLRCERVDASGKIVMPGLINAHHHFYSTLVTGLGKAAPSKDFNAVLENLWWRLDKKLAVEDVYISALVSALNAIRKGCTTIIDHHASPHAVTGSLAAIAKAVKECGIRASLCYEVSDRDGAEICREGIAENVQWLEKTAQDNDPFLKGLFGMHAAFTLSDATLREISDRVLKLGCGTHIHAAEAESDELYNIQNHGKRVVERLCDFGLVNAHSILAHGVHLNAREMMLVAEKNAAIVTNPQSNLNNAVGIADVCKMAELGVTVGLGTDAMTVDMLEELRVGLWAQHLRQQNPSTGFMEIANTLVRNNPRIAQKYWGPGHGTIAAGNPADIVFVEYDPHTPLTAETWLGHLIYGISEARMDTTICAGEILMWNGQLTLDIDEAEVRERSRQLAGALWDRF
ncbi:MAG TPA: putative aminohydrolase SsnA [Candidatus Syntrophosphaera sp.]|jgi:putative selenium metabolism protein SsnA|nr:putative aminohydrolase SsnA [Candidatus Syntrophosphaera sp.]